MNTQGIRGGKWGGIDNEQCSLCGGALGNHLHFGDFLNVATRKMVPVQDIGHGYWMTPNGHSYAPEVPDRRRERIQYLYANSDLTQKQIAARLGVSVAVVHKTIHYVSAEEREAHEAEYWREREERDAQRLREYHAAMAQANFRRVQDEEGDYVPTRSYPDAGDE